MLATSRHPQAGTRLRTPLRRVPALALLIALALGLVACGGGGGAQPAPTQGAAQRAPAPTLAPAASPAAAAPAPAASPAAPTSPAAASPVAAASPAAAASPRAGVVAPAPGELGSPQKPLRMAFVPSQDSQKVLASGRPLADLLTQETGYTFEVSVPTNFTAVIEAMGAENVDIGWLNPFSYALARKKYGTEVILSSVRQGSKNYRAQIITHVDSGIKTLEDLRGKRFAFVDAASSSGFLYPVSLLQEKVGLDPKNLRGFFSEIVYAGGHDKVVIAVYNRQVDAGATFGNSNPNGPITDARTSVRGTIPDVIEKVIPIAETDPIPNDTVSVRKGLPPEVVQRIKDGLLRVAASDQGKELLRSLYNIDGLSEATDADYAPLRQKAEAVGIDLEEAIRPASPAPSPSPSPAAR